MKWNILGWVGSGLFLFSPLLAAEEEVIPVSSQAVEGKGTVTAPAGVSGKTVLPITTALPANVAESGSGTLVASEVEGVPSRGLFESDHAFDRFIGPMSSPVLSQDPRALTQMRFFFINNQVDASNPAGIDNFQAYTLPLPQTFVALSDRLTLTANKDGYAVINNRNGTHTEGFLDAAAGLKYTFYRDVENQALAAFGFMFDVPVGTHQVHQGFTNGLFTPYLTAGKEFFEDYHLLGTLAYQFPVNDAVNSSFFFTTVHIDRRCFDFLYPMIEVNWYHYLSGGNLLPQAVGEGDGLLNLGTQGMGGRDLVTLAPGLKGKLGNHIEVGASWEFPISQPHMLINNRLLVDLVLRY